LAALAAMLLELPRLAAAVVAESYQHQHQPPLIEILTLRLQAVLAETARKAMPSLYTVREVN
jgi:hypothetical protein